MFENLDKTNFTKDNEGLVIFTENTPTRNELDRQTPDSLSNYSPLASSNSSYDFDSRIFTFSEDSQTPKKIGDQTVTMKSKYIDLNRAHPLIIRWKYGGPVSYQFHQKIAQGAYGQVVCYKVSDPKMASDCRKIGLPTELCLKVGLKMGDLDTDMEIIDLFDDVIPNFLVPTQSVLAKISRQTDSTNEVESESPTSDLLQPILIMPKMDGTLKQLVNQLVFSNIYDKYWLITAVLYSVNMAFYQLVKNRVYYTDIKISNILYRLESGVLTICLGDLGSASLAKDREAIATFPNTNRSRCHHFAPIAFDLVYGLMIILFEMMATSSKDGVFTQKNDGTLDRELFQHLFHENIKGLTLEQRHNIINVIFSNLKELPVGNVQTSDDRTILEFLEVVKKYCYTNADKKKTADTLKILKSLLPVWQRFYQKFSKESRLAQAITVKLQGL